MNNLVFEKVSFVDAEPGTLWCRDTNRNKRLVENVRVMLYVSNSFNQIDVVKYFQTFYIDNNTPIINLGISKLMKMSSYFNSTKRKFYKVMATTVDGVCMVGWIADQNAKKLTPYEGVK